MKNKLVIPVSALLIAGTMTACANSAIPPSIAAADLSTPFNIALHDDNETSYIIRQGDGGTLADALHNDTLTDNILATYLEYEQYGLTYDMAANQLFYKNKLVRYFEDYYPVGNDDISGISFFNEKGTIDVHAKRDFSQEATNTDGAINPAGKLIGLEPYSQQEFDNRNIDELKNPKTNEALSGGTMTTNEKETAYSVYSPYGVTYDMEKDCFYYNGKKVRYFLDILASNGESLTSGKFVGNIRTLGSDDGEVDIYTVRDFSNADINGNGKLTDIKAYSQAEFDARTNEQKHTTQGATQNAN